MSGGPPVAGMAGMAGGAAGMAGGGAGMAGMVAGGMGGGGMGGGGMGGGAAGMMGGMGGMGGMAGTDMPPPDGAIQRGPAPTEADTLKNGPYTTMSYTSGMRNGPEYAGATIYYPTSAEAKPPFGAVAIVPGFTAYQSSIRDWGPFLASHGIVAMTIDTNSTSDPPQTRAGALMDALKTVAEENTREGSPLKGKIDTNRFGVAGWSMGGGGTLIAASRNPTLKAAVSFAAWGPTGGAQNKVPALMFEATADILAASMSDGYYAQVPDTTPKMLFEVSGSSHNVANSPKNHNNIIGKYGLSWFKTFLEGDTRYRQFLTGPKPSITTSKYATNVK